MTENGVTGNGGTGNVVTGIGVTETGATGIGVTATGVTGNGMTRTGVTGSGLTATGVTATGVTGSGVTRDDRAGGSEVDDPKACLHRYLQSARDAMLSKLDGLPEYDVRRPLTPTGTNLLGLVKHLASCELAYFGDVFGRPSGIALPWFEDGAESNADMWATAEESRESIVALYRQAWAHADATFDALSLEETGRVPWWPQDRADATLHRIMVHMVAETHRHAGHADIVRELIDGRAGLNAPGDNVPQESPQWWTEYRDRLESAARAADRG